MKRNLLTLNFILTSLFSIGQTNLANGTFSGGNAEVVQIEALGGASVYASDLQTDCSAYWYPQGTLCNSADVDSQTQSTKQNNASGATWDTMGNGYDAVGVLVIDLGSVQNIQTLQVYQMFSDGKTTHIQFFYHADTSTVAPDYTDSGWTSLTNEHVVSEGDISDNTVTLPTSISVASTATRYLKIHARNDGSYGDATYIELRNIKVFGSVLTSQNFESTTNLKFYPNPSKAVFAIDSYENVNVEIFDLLGKLILKREIISGYNTLDLSGFQDGFYFAKVLNTNGKIDTYKLVKE